MHVRGVKVDNYPIKPMFPANIYEKLINRRSTGSRPKEHIDHFPLAKSILKNPEI